MSALALPKRSRGRQSCQAQVRYRTEVEAFCRAIREIASTLDFAVSSRGWCYILEEYGLKKGDFDAAQTLINECRKNGDLPLDICAEDSTRQADHLEDLDDLDVEDYADDIVDRVRHAHLFYTPFSIWNDLDTYVEVAVEKIDLKSLFASVCEPYSIALTNIRGWSDLNSRAAMMRRFSCREAEGKQIVLLFCGDHDPGGLAISDFLLSNMGDMSRAVGWQPSNLIVERFGLNVDFIEKHGLTWIDNLETSTGARLDDPKHPDHHKPYVQSYLNRFGARKVEANALVVRPQAGRELCRQAILRYVPDGALGRHKEKLSSIRSTLRDQIAARSERGAP
jgi:hypothetical protein